MKLLMMFSVIFFTNLTFAVVSQDNWNACLDQTMEKKVNIGSGLSGYVVNSDEPHNLIVILGSKIYSYDTSKNKNIRNVNDLRKKGEELEASTVTEAISYAILDKIKQEKDSVANWIKFKSCASLEDEAIKTTLVSDVLECEIEMTYKSNNSKSVEEEKNISKIISTKALTHCKLSTPQGECLMNDGYFSYDNPKHKVRYQLPLNQKNCQKMGADYCQFQSHQDHSKLVTVKHALHQVSQYSCSSGKLQEIKTPQKNELKSTVNSTPANSNSQKILNAR